MRHRAPLAAVLAAVVALLPALALPALAGSTAPGADAVGTTAASGPKVVIVVGATHEATASYRSYANLMYAEAIKYTPNVVKVYSPNATWKNVKAAAQGASILIYLGHGSGYPRDDSAVFNPNGHDGMGLNSASNKSDYVAKYYGESYMANDIRLAKNAVVILSHLCFASGNSMSGDPEPTYAVAEQRIDNFASGFLRAGARTVIADVWNSGVIHYIRSIFTTNQSIGNMWAVSPSNHGHQMPFTPIRNPAYQAVMDPNNWTSGFYRSIVAAPEMRTTDVVEGASESLTSKHPSTFQAPGAAAVGDAPVSLYQGAALGESTGAALPAGEVVRVTDVVPADDGASDPALEVETLDGSIGGWVDGAGLIPRDSAGPELWSMDGPGTISPNFDGYLDRLNLWARFSESVDWSVKLKDSGGDVVRTQDGTGHQAGITWDALPGGDPAPDGDYTWHLKASDAWGNPVLDEDGAFTIANEAVPGTARPVVRARGRDDPVIEHDLHADVRRTRDGSHESRLHPHGHRAVRPRQARRRARRVHDHAQRLHDGIGDPDARVGRRRRRGGAARPRRRDRLQDHDRPLRPLDVGAPTDASEGASRSAAGRTRRSR